MIHTILIIYILTYLLSIYGAYKFIRLAHYNYQGKYVNILPYKADIVIMFIPFLNITPSLLCLFGYWKATKHRNTRTNFFKPKK